jgi:uncharacterized protein YegL
MATDMALRMEELVNNPTARVPVCLCLDTSGSMTGEPIDELNSGVEQFLSALQADDAAQYSAEVAVVTFGGTVSILLDFAALGSQAMPRLGTSGLTPMAQGVHVALDLLEKRKKEYAEAGVDYFQPWLVLMTDGQPEPEDVTAMDNEVQRTAALVQARKLTIFPIGIGPSANMSVLARLSPQRPPLRLKGLNFKAFFEWLSKSVSRVSQSIPGQAVPLDEKGIKGWAQL